MSYVLKGLVGNYVTYVAHLPNINQTICSVTPHITNAKVYYDREVAMIDAKEFEMEVVNYDDELKMSKK